MTRRRAKSVKVKERNALLSGHIKAIKVDHPLWGYRRVWAYLKFRQGLPVNKKRIHRLMKEHGLLVTPEVRNKAKRGPFRPKPKAQYPNHIWGIDMTKVKLANWGWLYLVIILDWYTKEIIGYRLDWRSRTQEWLAALELAVNRRFPRGIRDSLQQELFLVSDNGCQPTSERFMECCATLGLKQIFTTWSNPKGNSDTERVIRTLKEDLVWTHDWDDPFVFEHTLRQWIDDYNTDFPHQSLRHQTPDQCYQNYVNTNAVPVLT